MKSRSFSIKFVKNSGLYILTVSFLLTACGMGGQQGAPQQQSGEQQQQQEKEPQKLKDIEKSIEDIMKTLEGPAAQIGRKEEQKEQQGGEQQATSSQSSQGGQQGQQGQQSSQQGSQQGAQQGQQQQQSQPQPKDPWTEVSSSVEKLHFDWNEFKPEAVKKGAGVKITDSFSNALNHLTTVASTRDKNSTLLAANGLYGCIPDLFSLYRTKMSPEVKRLHYLVRNVVLTSAAGDWSQADRDVASLKASWDIARGTLGKEQDKDQAKLDLSISELEKVEKARDRQLTDIKGKVAFSNIQSVEKSYEKESESS